MLRPTPEMMRFSNFGHENCVQTSTDGLNISLELCIFAWQRQEKYKSLASSWNEWEKKSLSDSNHCHANGKSRSLIDILDEIRAIKEKMNGKNHIEIHIHLCTLGTYERTTKKTDNRNRDEQKIKMEMNNKMHLLGEKRWNADREWVMNKSRRRGRNQMNEWFRFIPKTVCAHQRQYDSIKLWLWCTRLCMYAHTLTSYMKTNYWIRSRLFLFIESEHKSMKQPTQLSTCCRLTRKYDMRSNEWVTHVACGFGGVQIVSQWMEMKKISARFDFNFWWFQWDWTAWYVDDIWDMTISVPVQLTTKKKK